MIWMFRQPERKSSCESSDEYGHIDVRRVKSLVLIKGNSVSTFFYCADFILNVVVRNRKKDSIRYCKQEWSHILTSRSW